MKFSGRIIAVVIAIFTLSSWWMSNFLINHVIIYTAVLLLFFWWLGKQYDNIRCLAERDDLTGLYNRRYLMRNFHKIAKRRFNLSIVDVNDFKSINDTYGHSVGDMVLQHLSSILKGFVDNKDIVVRMGGDEFIVISKSEFVLCPRFEIDFNNDITVSITTGTAAYPDNGETLADLMKIADANMYHAKKQ